MAFSKVVTNVIAGEFVDVGIFPADNPAAQALGAKPLEEETSFNISAGVVVTPVENLTLTADYFRIRINNQILLGATFDDQASVDLLAAAGFSNIQGVQYFTNGLDTRTQGVDITAGYKVPAGASGTLELSAGINVTRNKIIHVDPLPQVLVDAGSTEPGLLDSVTAIGIQDERPDWRGTLQANYTVGRFTSLGRYSYYGGFSSAQPGFCDLCRENYGGKGLFDAEIGYRFNLVKLSVGVRNLFDVYPDQPSSTGRGGRRGGYFEGLQRQLRHFPLGGGVAVRIQRPVPLREDGAAVVAVAGNGERGTGNGERGTGSGKREAGGDRSTAPPAVTVPFPVPVPRSPFPVPRFFETPYQSWRPLSGRGKIPHPYKNPTCLLRTISSSSAAVTTVSSPPHIWHGPASRSASWSGAKCWAARA